MGEKRKKVDEGSLPVEPKDGDLRTGGVLPANWQSLARRGGHHVPTITSQLNIF